MCLMELGALMAHFVAAKTGEQTIPGAPETCGMNATKTFQGGIEMATRTIHHNTSRC